MNDAGPCGTRAARREGSILPNSIVPHTSSVFTFNDIPSPNERMQRRVPPAIEALGFTSSAARLRPSEAAPTGPMVSSSSTDGAPLCSKSELAVEARQPGMLLLMTKSTNSSRATPIRLGWSHTRYSCASTATARPWSLLILQWPLPTSLL